MFDDCCVVRLWLTSFMESENKKTKRVYGLVCVFHVAPCVFISVDPHDTYDCEDGEFQDS